MGRIGNIINRKGKQDAKRAKIFTRPSPAARPEKRTRETATPSSVLSLKICGCSGSVSLKSLHSVIGVNILFATHPPFRRPERPGGPAVQTRRRTDGTFCHGIKTKLHFAENCGTMPLLLREIIYIIV